jgi:putative hydrolase of the HAD superfamily
LTGQILPHDPMPPLFAVLFDAAGTLIELREPVGETYARIAREWGVELPAWRLDDAFTRVLRRTPPTRYCNEQPEIDAGAVAQQEREWWQGIVRSTFLAADSTLRFADFDAFFGATFDHYAGASAWRLREGARDALAALAALELHLGVISNFDQRLTELLHHLGIASFFECVMIPAHCGDRKPAARIFHSALRELGVESCHTLYVGDDTEAELAAVRALGLRTLDVRELETLKGLPAYIEAHATLA